MSKWIKVNVGQGSSVTVDWGYAKNKLIVGGTYSMGLGSIKLFDRPLRVERYSGSGSFSYFLVLKPGNSYRLGAGYGHRIVPAKEEQDPIKRVLREMEIPVTKIVRHQGELVEVQYHSDDLAGKIGERTERLTLTDGILVGGEEDRVGGGPNWFTYSGTRQVQKATYAVEYASCTGMGGGHYNIVVAVHVFPDCEAEKIGDALAQIVFESDQVDYEYTKVRDIETARRWIDGLYEYDPEETVSYDGKSLMEVLCFRRKVGYGNFTVRLDDAKYCIEAPVGNLCRKFGVEVLKGLYETKKASFESLFENVEAAEKYITSRFKIRKTPTGSSWAETKEYRDKDMNFQIAEKGAEQWMGPIYGGWYVTHQPYPKIVEVLLRKHGDELKRRLFEQAPPSKGYWGKVE